jgi:Fe2+ transport system protein FeoA
MKNQHRHRRACPGCGHDTMTTDDLIVNLDKCLEDTRVLIRTNPDIKTLEMGLCSGASLRVLRNDNSDASMIVCLYGQSYVIPKKIAEQIEVKRCSWI